MPSASAWLTPESDYSPPPTMYYAVHPPKFELKSDRPIRSLPDLYCGAQCRKFSTPFVAQSTAFAVHSIALIMQYSVRSPQYSIRSTQYRVRSTQYSVRSTIQRSQYAVQRSAFVDHSTAFAAHGTAFLVHSTAFVCIYHRGNPPRPQRRMLEGGIVLPTKM